MKPAEFTFYQQHHAALWMTLMLYLLSWQHMWKVDSVSIILYYNRLGFGLIIISPHLYVGFRGVSTAS